jgi:hypothetical protein
MIPAINYQNPSPFIKEFAMQNVIAVVIVFAVLGGILFAAKRFLKAPKGELPDCCKGGNKEINLRR